MHIWNTSWDIFSPNGMRRNLYRPLCVLNVVRYDEGVSRCIDQNPSLASNLEKTVAPDSLCEISSSVGAL